MTAATKEVLIYVSTEGGGSRSVQGVIRRAYGIHRQLINGGVSEDGWTVTHLRSGIRVWGTRSREEAGHVADWLNDFGPLPPVGDYEEMMAWPAANPEKAKDLTAALTSIAPKFAAPGAT